MSVYIYLTAERKIDEEWKLIAPLHENEDWGGVLSPTLIIDGGWPKLAEAIISNTKNLSLPPDISVEFQNFYNNVLKSNWRVGWGMYSTLKNIRVESTANNKLKLSSLFKNISLNKDSLRLIYWWG